MRHWMLVGLLSFGACDGQENETDTDAGGPEGNATVDDAGARIAHGALFAPGYWTLIALDNAANAEQIVDCPVVTIEGDTTTLSGDGCTDETGITLNGSVSVTRPADGSADVTWSQLVMSYEGAPVWTIDGHATMSAAHELTVEDLHLGGGAVAEWDMPAYDYTYASYTLGDLGQYEAVLGGEPGTVDVAGDVTIEGLGAGTFSGTMVMGECDDEYDSGAPAFTGDFTVSYTLDGATDCDGCVPWTSNDASGELCAPIY